MKKGYLVIIILSGALALLLLRLAPRSVTKPFIETPDTGHPQMPLQPADMMPPTAKAPPTHLLSHAYETAAFIDHVINSMPEATFTSRTHLKGLQAIFFISDYVMIAKTNSSLILSQSAVADAFTNVSSDTSDVRDRLLSWAVRSHGTLTDHYRSISEVPAEKDNIKAIKAALTENGVVIDTESDLLMDCIRYAADNTSLQEMYGPAPKETMATPDPVALNLLRTTGDTVFRHRFSQKHALDPRVIANLMDRIKDVRIYRLSPADVQIPVSSFQ
jgi:hypothetical protein